MALPVTATQNSTWVATEALTMLGKASADNPPSAEDLALATSTLVVVAANLSGRGIAYFADLDSVPSGLALELARALAISLKPHMGDDSPDGEAIPPLALVEANMRRLSADAVASLGPQQVQWL